MKYKILLPCLITCISLFYVNGVAQQNITNYYNNQIKEKIKEQYQAKIIGKDTIKDGTYTFFYENGIEYQKGIFKNDKLEGKWLINYPAGSKKSIISFTNNQRNGVFISFFESGELQVEGVYKNNLRDSVFTEYYESGKPKSKYNYKEAIRRKGIGTDRNSGCLAISKGSYQLLPPSSTVV